MTLTVGSVFAGIGGIDLGLTNAGDFSTRWYSETDSAALRVMQAHYPDAGSLGDVRFLSKHATPVDVLVGGPPCQDISTANASGRKGLKGARSGLFHAYMALVETITPRWVVMEQVPGLMTSNNGNDLFTVLAAFERQGYEVAGVTADSLAYVAQRRRRLVFVAHRHVRAAARALLPLTQDGAGHLGAKLTTREAPARRAADSPLVYRKSRRAQSVNDPETWVSAWYCNTLTHNDRGESRATVIVLDKHGRPRVMTPVEWERAHGFPDDWTALAGSDSDRYRLLGNAVSPPVAERVGAGILAVEQETMNP
jgi:DNA (cytosine-5)-methyltransferase 1